MATAVRLGIASSFTGASAIGGARAIGSSLAKSSSSLASKISSFKTIASGSKEGNPVFSRGLTSRDTQVNRSGIPTAAELKINAKFGPAMNGPSSFGVENRPNVKILGNPKSFPAFGENGPARPNITPAKQPQPRVMFADNLRSNIEAQTSQVWTKAKARNHELAAGRGAEAPKVETESPAQPNVPARGSERILRSVNTPNNRIDFATFQFIGPIPPSTQEAPAKNIFPKVEAKPAPTPDKPIEVPAQNLAAPTEKAAETPKAAPRLDRKQAFALLALQPLVEAGILTRDEALIRVGAQPEAARVPTPQKLETQPKSAPREITLPQVAERTSLQPTPELARFMQLVKATQDQAQVTRILSPLS